MNAKAALAEISFHDKRYNEAMNHLKEVEVLNDEFLKGSKSDNKDYFVNSKILLAASDNVDLPVHTYAFVFEYIEPETKLENIICFV